jgi:hypothetical protein
MQSGLLSRRHQRGDDRNHLAQRDGSTKGARLVQVRVVRSLSDRNEVGGAPDHSLASLRVLQARFAEAVPRVSRPRAAGRGWEFSGSELDAALFTAFRVERGHEATFKRTQRTARTRRGRRPLHRQRRAGARRRSDHALSEVHEPRRRSGLPRPRCAWPAQPSATLESARPSATGWRDGLGERRGRGACPELLPLKGERVSPRGGGSVDRDRSAPSGPCRCLGGVGERQLDRQTPKETSRDRPNVPPHTGERHNGGANGATRASSPKPRALATRGEQTPPDTAGVPGEALSERV